MRTDIIVRHTYAPVIQSYPIPKSLILNEKPHMKESAVEMSPCFVYLYVGSYGKHNGGAFVACCGAE